MMDPQPHARKKMLTKSMTGLLFGSFEEAVRRKWPELWQLGNWFLHHDNAPAHTALRVVLAHYLTSQGFSAVPHPPYSPDLAPCDFFLFPRMQKMLKGKRFDDVEAVKSASQRALDSIKADELKNCFKQWEKKRDGCISSNGEYFEGD